MSSAKAATIILVDDDCAALAFVKRCLQEMGGYSVLAASSAEQAIAICDGHGDGMIC
jgi:CheY-like chemotaxis protein